MAAVLLGPAAGVIVMTSVLIVQCLMFADGGLLALGANVFNMAIASTCGGYLAYRAVRFLAPMRGPRGIVFAASFAGWCGTVLGAISCAGQLALSNTAPWEVVFPAMANIHMIIGLGEGLVTGLIVAAVLRARPELVVAENPEDTAVNGVAGYVATLALGFIVFVAPFASPWPDGLEHVAAKLGFEHQAQSSALRGAFPDYQVPFVGSPALATVIAGVAGAVMAFLAAWLLSKYLVPGLSVRKDGPHGN
jgi:cobalt/nickel transport system permease protein